MTIRRKKARFLADALLLFSVQRHLGLIMVPIHARLDQGPQADDPILGNDGSDTIDGDSGDDVLFGQGGADRLTGGTGADIFVFDQDILRDQINDFEVGLDRIDLSRWEGIYHPSLFTLRIWPTGGDLLFHDLSIRIVTDDASPLTQDFLHSDNFLF